MAELRLCSGTWRCELIPRGKQPDFATVVMNGVVNWYHMVNAWLNCATIVMHDGVSLYHMAVRMTKLCHGREHDRARWLSLANNMAKLCLDR